jgi:hypothetical protein
MVPELNGGEGVSLSGWGAALGSGEALGPAHGERGGVRRLGIDGAMENIGGAVVTAYRRRVAVGARTKHEGNVLFIAAYCVGATRTYAEGEREVTAQHDGRASVLAHAARRSGDVAVATVLRGADVENVCPYAVGEEVSWTGGESMRPHGTHGCASAPCLGGYARASAGLCRGLDDTLLVTSVRLVGQAAQGFVV